MIVEKYIEIFMSNLPYGSRHASKCVEMNCPACTYMGERRPDNRTRGGFFNRGNAIGYNCFNCGFKFRADNNSKLPFKAIKLLELMGARKEEINQLHFLALQADPSRALGVTKKKPQASINLDFKDVALPKGTMMLHDIIKDADMKSDAFAAYVYAKERCIDHYPYLLWSDSTQHELNKRLMIPYLYKDRVVGFNARRFDTDDKETRYFEINPNKNFVYNVDTIFNNERKVLIINESPFDSIIYDGVATMGADMTQDHVNLINRFKGKKILVPDLDKTGKRAIDVAISNEWGVYFPTWSYNYDMGEAVKHFGKLYVLNDIMKNTITSPLEIEIKKNLM